MSSLETEHCFGIRFFVFFFILVFFLFWYSHLCYCFPLIFFLFWHSLLFWLWCSLSSFSSSSVKKINLTVTLSKHVFHKQNKPLMSLKTRQTHTRFRNLFTLKRNWETKYLIRTSSNWRQVLQEATDLYIKTADKQQGKEVHKQEQQRCVSLPYFLIWPVLDADRKFFFSLFPFRGFTEHCQRKRDENGGHPNDCGG